MILFWLQEMRKWFSVEYSTGMDERERNIHIFDLTGNELKRFWNTQAAVVAAHKRERYILYSSKADAFEHRMYEYQFVSSFAVDRCVQRFFSCCQMSIKPNGFYLLIRFYNKMWHFSFNSDESDYNDRYSVLFKTVNFVVKLKCVGLSTVNKCTFYLFFSGPFFNFAMGILMFISTYTKSRGYLVSYYYRKYWWPVLLLLLFNMWLLISSK